MMQLAARDDAKVWLDIAAGAYDSVMRMATRQGRDPSGYSFKLESKTARRFGWLGGRRQRDPAMAPLCKTGVLARSPDGRFSMPDPDGVGRALAELQMRRRMTLIETRRTLRRAP